MILFKLTHRADSGMWHEVAMAGVAGWAGRCVLEAGEGALICLAKSFAKKDGSNSQAFPRKLQRAGALLDASRSRRGAGSRGSVQECGGPPPLSPASMQIPNPEAVSGCASGIVTGNQIFDDVVKRDGPAQTFCRPGLEFNPSFVIWPHASRFFDNPTRSGRT